MARGVNKVILLGHLGKAPEVRYFPNGDPVASASLATSSQWTDKASGERKEHTEWHNLVFRRKLAEIADQYLDKGSKIYVEGFLRTRKWQDKDTGKDRFTTEIVVDDLQMLDSKPQEAEGARGNAASQQGGGYRPRADRQAQGSQGTRPAHAAPPDAGFEDDDIPFD